MYMILLLISFSILSATYWASDAVVPESPAALWGSWCGDLYGLNHDIFFYAFIGFFFLDVILYLIVLLLQPVCEVGFIPNKVPVSDSNFSRVF